MVTFPNSKFKGYSRYISLYIVSSIIFGRSKHFVVCYPLCNNVHCPGNFQRAVVSNTVSYQKTFDSGTLPPRSSMMDIVRTFHNHNNHNFLLYDIVHIPDIRKFIAYAMNGFFPSQDVRFAIYI